VSAEVVSNTSVPKANQAADLETILQERDACGVSSKRVKIASSSPREHV
jgi:hypothetical protein